MRLFSGTLMRLIMFVVCVLPAAEAFGVEAEKAAPQRVGYLEDMPLWTASQALQYLLAEADVLHLAVVPGAFFSPARGNSTEMEQAAAALMARTDLDIILVAGSASASALLRANNGRTPILAFVIEDGAARRVLEEASAAGAHNFAMRLDTGFARQGLEFFHYHTKFRRLGIFFRPGELENPFSIANTVIGMGRSLRFDIVTQEIPLTETLEECREGIAQLMAKNIDAFYVGGQQCFDPQKGYISSLLEPLTRAAVPTFAREGADVVRQGAFMGNSSNDFVRRKDLLAQQISRIFSGVRPDKVSADTATVPRYSLNLRVLESIGFDPSFELLAACDEFFEHGGLHVPPSISLTPRGGVGAASVLYSGGGGQLP